MCNEVTVQPMAELLHNEHLYSVILKNYEQLQNLFFNETCIST